MTPRLILRPLEPDDATQRYLDWFDDPDTRRFIVAARERQTLDSIRFFIERRRMSESALLLGIFERQHGLHIGNIKFEPIDLSTGRAVLGVLIGDAAWRGRGIFTEAFEVSATWLCKNFGLREIWLSLDRTHAAAIRGYLRAGFCEASPPEELFGAALDGLMYMQRDVSGG